MSQTGQTTIELKSISVRGKLPLNGRRALWFENGARLRQKNA